MPGKISFTLDAWTSSNCIPFLGITAHWISDKWELKNTIVDFVKLEGPHSGKNIKEVFLNSLNNLGITTKVNFYKLSNNNFYKNLLKTFFLI